jgi:dTDP-4-amino-4,6-dideoxygalactose transaminase
MVKDSKIAFIDLAAQQARIRPHLDSAIKGVLDHGNYVQGPEVAAFESALSQYTGVPHVLGCADGTDALTMVLMALDVGPGDAVFVPPFTFISTAEVVALRGATPVFVDVREDTYNMCPKSLESAIQNIKKTDLKAKGIISVDLFGQPADHKAIQQVADQHKLWVMVDAAQSLGATYEGKHTVNYGIAATTSFFPAKPLGGYGDGGAIFTHDAELAAKLKMIRLHGQGSIPYETSVLGITGRLDTLQAAILIEKLKIFPEEVEARNRVADTYTKGLTSIQTPFVEPHNISVWAQYTIQVEDRDALREHLKEKGIPTGIYYPKPLHTQLPYQAYPRTDLAVTEKICERVMSLPMHPYLTGSAQDYIIEAIQRYLK